MGHADSLLEIAHLKTKAKKKNKDIVEIVNYICLDDNNVFITTKEKIKIAIQIWAKKYEKLK